MSGADRLTKSEAALLIFFLISLLALSAQLFHTLRRRRRPKPASASAADDRNTYSSPKDPLSFFRLQSHGARPESGAAAPPSYGGAPDLDAEVLDIDLLMLQGLFGPPRFLYTIKEEREEWGSPADKSRFSASRIEEIRRSIGRIRVTLADRFREAEDSGLDAAAEVENGAAGGGGCGNTTR